MVSPISIRLRRASITAALISTQLGAQGGAVWPEIPSDLRARGWYKFDAGGNTAVVFVHGILSNDVDAFLFQSKRGAAPRAYFPKLTADDARLDRPSVFLANYYTDFTSQAYTIADAARDVFQYQLSDSADGRGRVLDKTNIIFVGHSLGGIIVRRILTEYRQAFARKNIAVLLIASPSHGSRVPEYLRAVIHALGQDQAAALAPNGDWIEDLHRRFSSLTNDRQFHVIGRELCETKRLGGFWGFGGVKVVPLESCSVYFGPPVAIADADHVTIAKPTDRDHPTYREFRALASQLADSARAWQAREPHAVVDTVEFSATYDSVEVRRFEWPVSAAATCEHSGSPRSFIFPRRMDDRWNVDPLAAIPQVEVRNAGNMGTVSLTPSDSLRVDIWPISDTQGPSACPPSDSLRFVVRGSQTRSVPVSVRWSKADSTVLRTGDAVATFTPAAMAPTGTIWRFRLRMHGISASGDRWSDIFESERETDEVRILQLQDVRLRVEWKGETAPSSEPPRSFRRLVPLHTPAGSLTGVPW